MRRASKKKVNPNRQLNSYKPANDFLERESELADIHALLTASNKLLLVNGMGGVGKTTMARAILDHFSDTFTHYAWVNGRLGLKEALVNDYQLINSLDLLDEVLKIKANLKSASIDACFDLIIARLRDLDPFGLLVIDDVDETQQYLIDALNLSSNWKILVTSRERLADFRVYDLGVLNEPSAIQLFGYFSKINDDRPATIQATRNIVNAVWRHTLSIEVLAKTIAGNKELDVVALEKTLRDRGIRAVPDHEIKTAYLKDHGADDRIKTTARECLTIAFDLSLFADNKQSLYILSIFSVLPPVPVSYSLLKQTLEVQAADAVQFQNHLNHLAGKGWLTETESNYYMHPVIQEAVREKLHPSPKTLSRLISFLTEKSDSYAYLQLEEVILYSAFIKSLIQYFQETGSMTTAIATLIYHYAVLLRNIGKPKDALTFHEFALPLRGHDGIWNAEYAESLCGLAACYIDLNDLDQAEELLHEVIKIQQKVLDPKDFNIGISHHNLSVIYKKKAVKDPSFLDRAVAETRLTIEILENQPEHRDKLAIALIQKSQLLKRQGNYTEALAALDQVWEIRKDTFGENAKETLRVDEEKALVYKEMKDYETGFALIDRVLKVYPDEYTPDSLKLAMPYHNGAFLAFHTGKKELALDWQLKSVTILSQHHPPGDDQLMKAEAQLRYFRNNPDIRWC